MKKKDETIEELKAAAGDDSDHSTADTEKVVTSSYRPLKLTFMTA